MPENIKAVLAYGVVHRADNDWQMFVPVVEIEADIAFGDGASKLQV